MFKALYHSTSVLLLKLKYHWHFSNRAQTMKVMCQLVRTKNFLIMTTSFLFLFCTVYLASHPGWGHDYQLLDNNANLRVQAIPLAVKYFEVPESYLQLLGLSTNVSSLPPPSPVDTGRPGLVDQAVAAPVAVPRWSVLSDLEQRYSNSSVLSSLDVVLVSVTSSASLDKTLRLAASVKKHVPWLYLLLFDLGLDKDAREKLTIYCNLTSVCELLPFQSEPFPAYVRELEIGAYKALIMQACLVCFPTVWWIDSEEHFISNNTEHVLDIARRLGVAAWTAPSLDSTSALSHPNMFAYFGLTADDFYFHRMLQPSHYVFSSPAQGGAASLQLQQQPAKATMLLWLRCVLTPGCVSPPGAMSSGCKEKRPKFKYSGCHEFEASALSAALGRVFNFVQDYLLPYVAADNIVSPEGGSFVPLFGIDDKINMTAVHIVIERERLRVAAAAAASLAESTRRLPDDGGDSGHRSGLDDSDAYWAQPSAQPRNTPGFGHMGNVYNDDGDRP